MINKVVVVVFSLLFASPLFADNSWLKSSADFKNLYVSYIVHKNDCGLSEAVMRPAVEAEMLRARIKSSETWKDFFMFVSVECMKLEPGGRHTGYSFYVNTSFCTKVKMVTEINAGLSKERIMCQKVSAGQAVMGHDNSNEEMAKYLSGYFVESALMDLIKINL